MWLTGWNPQDAAPREAWKVEETAEVRRIRALPLFDSKELERQGRALVPEYSALLSRPGSGVSLKWPQALLLHWLHERNQAWYDSGRDGFREGAYGGLPPGVGKTLITKLAPIVLDSRKPFLIAPASLHRDKTSRDFQRYSRAGWLDHDKPTTLVNIEAMSLDQNVNFLLRERPDLVMVDECDLLRNPESAAFVRLAIYREAAPEAVFVFLTGSGMRFGIDDYDTHVLWCLPNGGAPLPYVESERDMWREALRARPKGRPTNAVRRPRAGALLSLCSVPDMPADERPRTELEAAQLIVARRVNGTPGVLIIDDDDCDQPMMINLVRAPDDPVIDNAFARFYGFGFEQDDPDSPAGCLPNGEPLTDGLAVWRSLRSMGCGYCEFIDPPPPKEWAMKRRAYHRRCRSLILDSAWDPDPAHTPKAVRRLFPDDEAVLEWDEVQRKPFPPLDKPFKPKTATLKMSESVIRWGVEWLRKNSSLLWVGSVPLGRWIAQAAGVPYYGAEGLNEQKQSIEDIEAGTAAVLSMKANSRGRNLQDRFNVGGAIMLPQSADECHQLFKRLHRFGQTRPVRWDVLIGSGAADYGFDMTLYEAGLVKRQRRQTQTILRSTINRCILDSNNPRWFRKEAPQH